MDDALIIQDDGGSYVWLYCSRCLVPFSGDSSQLVYTTVLESGRGDDVMTLAAALAAWRKHTYSSTNHNEVW